MDDTIIEEYIVKNKSINHHHHHNEFMVSNCIDCNYWKFFLIKIFFQRSMDLGQIWPNHIE